MSALEAWDVPGDERTGAALKRPRVALIVGGQRSGSTLLSRVLGESPRAVALGEIWYLWERGVVEDRLCGCGVRFSECDFWQRMAIGGDRSSDAADTWGALRNLVRNR